MHLVKQSQSHATKNLARSEHRWQWSFILSILMICSIIVFWIWIQRYLENPTYIVQLESTRIEWPFPAVIVCPEVAFASHRIESFVTRLKYPSGLNETYARRVIRQLAAFFSPDVIYRLSDLENIETILDYNNIDVEAAGLNLTESCEESITRCRWQGEIVRCSTLFQMTLTAYGFCCIFNGRSLRRDMENTQSHQIMSYDQKFYLASSSDGGLMLIINQSLATPYDVNISYKWLSIHGSQRYIDLPGNGTPITPGTEMFVGYSTLGLQVDEDAVELNKNLRRCRMGYESLKYFPIYHKYHCSLIFTFCDRAATVPIGKKDYECPITCDAELDRLTLQTFDLDPNSYPFDSFYDDLDFKKISVVRVYVSNRNRRIFSRKAYFTKFQLFAQLGGVFNVFFGCSVLSMFEFVLILYRGVMTWISSLRLFRGIN